MRWKSLLLSIFIKKIPVLFSGEDMDALVGFINKTKASVGFAKSRGVLQFSLYFD